MLIKSISPIFYLHIRGRTDTGIPAPLCWPDTRRGGSRASHRAMSAGSGGGGRGPPHQPRHHRPGPTHQHCQWRRRFQAGKYLLFNYHLSGVCAGDGQPIGTANELRLTNTRRLWVVCTRPFSFQGPFDDCQFITSKSWLVSMGHHRRGLWTWS